MVDLQQKLMKREGRAPQTGMKLGGRWRKAQLPRERSVGRCKWDLGRMARGIRQKGGMARGWLGDNKVTTKVVNAF